MGGLVAGWRVTLACTSGFGAATVRSTAAGLTTGGATSGSAAGAAIAVGVDAVSGTGVGTGGASGGCGDATAAGPGIAVAAAWRAAMVITGSGVPSTACSSHPPAAAANSATAIAAARSVGDRRRDDGGGGARRTGGGGATAASGGGGTAVGATGAGRAGGAARGGGAGGSVAAGEGGRAGGTRGRASLRPAIGPMSTSPSSWAFRKRQSSFSGMVSPFPGVNEVVTERLRCRIGCRLAKARRFTADTAAAATTPPVCVLPGRPLIDGTLMSLPDRAAP